MSFETGVAWYDALPGLDPTQYDTPSDHWRRLFWSAQITKTRGAARPGHVASLHALACILLTGYRRGLGPECLSESLCLLRGLHGRGLGLARWTLDFGEALFAEHERTGAIEPIEEMVQVHEEAPITGTLGLDIRCQLAKALIARGSFTGEDADLSRAKCILDAIGPLLKAGPSSPHFAVVLAMQHVALDRTFTYCALEDMRSLADTLQGHLQRTDSRTQRYQMDLQAACFAISAIICTWAGSSEELNHCVQMADAAVLSLPHKSFAATIALSEFCMWYERCNAGERRYVQHSRRLVERMFHAAKGNSMYMNEAHHTLGRWMARSRYWAWNDHTTSIEIAATHHRQALLSCPPLHMYRSRYLTGLSSNLGRLYDLNGARTALNEVIALFETHTDVARRVPAFAINVSSVMILRAKSGRLRMDSKQALTQRAAQVLEDAILGTPPSSGYYTWLLDSLSKIYLLQLSWGCSLNGPEPLVLARRGVEAAVGGPASTLSRMQVGLARVLINNARQMHDVALLNEGIALLELVLKRPLPVMGMAIDSTVRHSGQIAWLRATAYMIRHRLLGISEDLHTAEAIFQPLCNGWGEISNTDRLELVLAWADAAHYAKQDATEMRAYQLIVSFLTPMACLGEEVATQVEALQLAEGLACRAAATFLTCGNIHGAIELLEQSRGVVWNQTLRLKTPISSVPPDYADDFARITGALKQTSNDTTDAATRRRDSASELDRLLERIRQVEGYERFLLPRAYLELKSCTSHGFVVLVIPSDTCTDILVMRSEEVTPTHLRLPSIQVRRLQDWTAELKRSCDHSRAAVSRDSERIGYKVTEPLPPPRAQAHLKVLRELWTEVVQPILASLGLERSENAPESRPRLWWCPAGPFAELPLHAAGIYRGANQDCLSNYVVSSYTPTLSALLDAQSAVIKNGPRDDSNILVVSVTHNSAGWPSLRSTRAEADRIQDIVPAAGLTVLSGHQSSLENVLKALPDVSVLHLACHGQQSQDDPLTSGFVLRDERLTLKRLMELHLPHAELAYLSACETASTDEYQPDEAINLAATMLFVGFKSVIATMWSMDDVDGPFVAERVYRAIFRDGKLDLNAVPYALDGAVKELRESGTHPSRWATYVHIGA